MVKHIESEVKEIYVGFLKDSKSSQPDSLPVNLLTVVSIDSLLNNLKQLLKSESTFMVPLKDKIATFHQELRFLRALLMDPSPKKHDNHEEVDGLLTNIEALISDAESAIHSFHSSDELGTSLFLCVFELGTANFQYAPKHVNQFL
ncbi:putative late blight resistance proteinR1A-4 [Abeliophyllum distichum]|uniref:Late blight resistance proteinR1A-4 n=1 Tax=Abeliophyllum distichum TaxID=126358 RepID=A0ABD1SFV5_9LAMI